MASSTRDQLESISNREYVSMDLYGTSQSHITRLRHMLPHFKGTAARVRSGMYRFRTPLTSMPLLSGHVIDVLHWQLINVSRWHLVSVSVPILHR